jgi:hypothetical protein
MRRWLSAILVFCVFSTMSAGCGTTKWSDTSRTATEQLLISDSMDRAVARLDFRAVAGKKVFLDSSPLSGVIDSAYLTSLLRQHMLAQGCMLMDDRKEADYVVEVRAGAVGTDRREVVFGVPATNVPDVVPMHGVPSSIPEMTLAKKTEQRAVTKIAVFAYNRHTGRPIWQSGIVPVESKAKDIWLFGAGPFQRGTIYEGTKFAGDEISLPLVGPEEKDHGRPAEVSVAAEAFFAEPQEQLAEDHGQPKQPPAGPAASSTKAAGGPPPAASEGVVHAGHTAPNAAPAPEPVPKPVQGAAPPLTAPPVLRLPDPPLLRGQTIAPPRAALPTPQESPRPR